MSTCTEKYSFFLDSTTILLYYKIMIEAKKTIFLSQYKSLTKKIFF